MLEARDGMVSEGAMPAAMLMAVFLVASASGVGAPIKGAQPAPRVPSTAFLGGPAPRGDPKRQGASPRSGPGRGAPSGVAQAPGSRRRRHEDQPLRVGAGVGAVPAI